MDRAWLATVHGVTKSQTLLKQLSTHIYIHMHTYNRKLFHYDGLVTEKNKPDSLLD